MRRRIVFILMVLLVKSLLPQAQILTVTNLAELSSATTTAELAIVKDVRSGGTFTYFDSAWLPDYGVVVPAGRGGVWVRSFDAGKGVNPCWWGAKGDGVANDLPAIKAATAYCLSHFTILQFPSGIFRITSPWVIGGKTIDEDDLFEGLLAKNITFNSREHKTARISSPLIIRGGVKTCIYGDFDTDTLTAVVYYNINGNGVQGHPTPHLYTHEFSNIGIYGRGFFKAGVPAPGTSPQSRGLQIGLVLLYSNNAKIESCSFVGLQYGLICKTSYFASLSNCYFETCGTGLSVFDFNASLLNNITGFYCRLLADITGSQLVCNNMNAEYCETAIVCKGKNIVFNGVYCENDNLKLPNRYQLILGRSMADRLYSKKSFTDGIVINGLTITAGGRDAVLFEEDTKQVLINAANINGIMLSKRNTTTIVINSNTGGLKIGGPAKQKIEKNISGAD